MTYVYDQYELESDYSYSGSYNNDVLINFPTILTNTIPIYTSSMFKKVVGSMISGLNDTSIGAVINESELFINESEIATLYKYTNRSPKRFLKLYCPLDIFYDSLMPDPYELYSQGTVDSRRHVLMIEKRGVLDKVAASYMILGYNIVTNSLTFTAIEGGPDPNFYTVDWNYRIFGNYKWAFQFPFQATYKNFPRKNQYVFTIPPFTDVSGAGVYKLASYTTTPTGSTLNSFHFVDTAKTTRPVNLSLGLAYIGRTIETPFIADTDYSTNGANYDDTRITKSLTQFADYYYGKNQVTWSAPPPEQLYFHFFGFGDYLGKFVSPERSLETAAVLHSYNSYARAVSTYDDPLSTQQGYIGWQYQLTTGSYTGYACRGYKYGIKKPIPENSYMIFRRGRFGQFRDILEQRQDSKFFGGLNDFTQIKFLPEAAVNITFASGSQSLITSSNSSLNSSDSGIYDTEAKSGQPFFDT